MSFALNVQFSGLCRSSAAVTDEDEVLCSRALSDVLTILCRRPLRHPPHLPPVRQRWLKSVLS